MTSHPAVVSRRDILCLGVAAAALGPGALAADKDDAVPDLLIGYTEFRTDLPGGRYVNVATRRAAVVKADGTGRRVLAEELTREAGYATQFVGWSPDGKAARLSCDWKSEEVGKWEEEHKDFRTTGEGVRHDAYLVDLASGKATMTWRGEELALSPARQGWTSQGYDPDAKGESPIRILAPPGTTLWLRELAFRPY